MEGGTQVGSAGARGGLGTRNSEGGAVGVRSADRYTQSHTHTHMPELPVVLLVALQTTIVSCAAILIPMVDILDISVACQGCFPVCDGCLPTGCDWSVINGHNSN